MGYLKKNHWYEMTLPNGEKQTCQWVYESGNYTSLFFTLRNGEEKDIMLNQVRIVELGENSSNTKSSSKTKKALLNFFLGISIIFLSFSALIYFDYLNEIKSLVGEWKKEVVQKVEQINSVSQKEVVKEVGKGNTVSQSEIKKVEKKSTKVEETNNRQQLNDQVNLNSLASIQGYLSGRYFIAGDGKRIEYRSSENALYMNGILFGYVSSFERVRTGIGGRNVVPFNVLSPYNHTNWLFGFYPPNIIRDQEGRNYYLK